MKVDRELLARHSSFTDEGIEERAVHFDIGGESCFGLLYQTAEVPLDYVPLLIVSHGSEASHL